MPLTEEIKRITLGKGACSRPNLESDRNVFSAYHLGEGRVLKTGDYLRPASDGAYHLGEGRVLKTYRKSSVEGVEAYHLGEGRVLKT